MQVPVMLTAAAALAAAAAADPAVQALQQFQRCRLGGHALRASDTD